MYRLPTHFDFDSLRFVNEETGEIFDIEHGDSLQIEHNSTKYDDCFLTPIALGEQGEIIYRLTYIKNRELRPRVWRSRELRAFAHAIGKLKPFDIANI